MDGYHIALFIHFLALLGAIATAAIVHFAAARRGRSKTVAEMIEWHTLIMGASKGFPVAIVTLVLSGSYMAQAGGKPIWASGFVTAGFTGVVLLLAVGAVMGVRGGILKKRLDDLVANGGANQAPNIPPDVVAETIERIPVPIVLAIVFDMTTKPRVGPALSIIGLAIVASAAPRLLRRPAASASRQTAD